MAEIKQEVNLFADEEAKGTQSVFIDNKDECEPWMVITHDGEEISLSVENWLKLVKLAEKALKNK